MHNIAVEHTHKDCPKITDKSGAGDVIFKVKYRFRGYTYPPCWKCHISSMGGNSLHGNYTTGAEKATCMHPNFMKGLLGEIWVNEAVRKDVQAYFNESWKDISAYRDWVVQPDPQHSTKSMALVVWFGKTYLGD
jgi:hypothetical protein